MARSKASIVSSSVLRGLVGQLSVGPGGGDEICLEPAAAGTSTTDAQDPGPDASFWYLFRGANAFGAGTHGFESQNGVPAAPRVTTTCP